MKILQNRALSFIIIAAVYIFTAIYGVFCYMGLPYPFWLKLLIADLLSTVVIFLFSVLFSNASVYDPYWSIQPAVIAVAFAVSAPSLNIAQILPLIAVLIWSVRLTANWAYTFKGLTHQDWRYTELKQKTGAYYPLINFLGIHLFPTLVVYACTLPVAYTLYYAPKFNAGSVVFFLLSMGAVALQCAADMQMHKFKKSGTCGFIDIGVWKYARHPNYLAEILMWWGIALGFICVMPQCWYLIAGAIINTLMFVFVSVPLADGRQAKKPNFAEYKSRTRTFLPIKKFK